MPAAHLLPVVIMLLMVGCAGPQTTRSTIDDYMEMSEAMTQSLLASDAISLRTPSSEPWFVAIRKVENLSNDVITESERWYVMARLQSSMPVQSMREHKNITFVLPVERRNLLRQYEELELGDAFGDERLVTHVLNATFRSAVRAGAKGRTDLYYCEFELFPVGGTVPVWTDRFEYKRVASGHIWD